MREDGGADGMTVVVGVYVIVRRIAIKAMKMSLRLTLGGSRLYSVRPGFGAATFLAHIKISPVKLIPIHFHAATDHSSGGNAGIRTTDSPS